MRLEARRIDRDTLPEVLDLAPLPEQLPLIAPVPRWLAQASVVPESESFGLFEGERAVGLFSVIEPACAEVDMQKTSMFPAGCLYLWRVMIDAAYQGRGLGRAALGLIYAMARERGHEGLALTTMDRTPHNALKFYEKLGFEPTGRRIDGELELVRRGPWT